MLKGKGAGIAGKGRMDPEGLSPTILDRHRPILLTGATGYVGSRLLKALEKQAYPLRCLARNPEYLRLKTVSSVDLVAGDVQDKATILPALKGIHTAFYLVHSRETSERDEGDFEAADRMGARNFGASARMAGVKRIIYLCGLGDDASPHLRSQQDVGRILRESGVPVIEFRASIVLGSGSLSFEMIRTLTERLPVMIAPRWVATLAQPIAIDDLIDYLYAAVEMPVESSRIFEIGGFDLVSYGGIMHEYARQRGLRRYIIPVPVLTPWLSSLWLALITPFYARVGRKLIGSILNPSIVRDDTARRVFKIRPMGFKEAIARALRNQEQGIAEARSIALFSVGCCAALLTQ